MELNGSLVFIMVVLVIDRIHGYPTGAPDDQTVCNTLMPGHYYDWQTTEMPYDVIVDGGANSGSYDATSNHTVTISGKSGSTFRGFILQARQYTTSEDFTRIGDFLTSDDARTTCQTNGGSTVTHVINNDKTSLQVLWVAPSNATGTVQFRGTIVQQYTTYWEFSPPIPSTPPGTTGEPPVAIDTAECGHTKGCYFSNCVDPSDPTQCEYGVTWNVSGPTTTAFELFASASFSATPYVALGLSTDTKMGADSVTDCIYSQASGSVNVQMSWNDGRSNTVLADKTMSLVSGSLSGSFSDGMLICRFSRQTYPPPPATNARSKRQTNSIHYPGSDVYHILIAKGPSSSGFKSQHTFQPAASTMKANFSQSIILSDSPTLSPFIKAHGIMMIFAWMVFASFGILMPRYFKTAWPGKKWGGKAIWFQLHQPLMIITLILTAAAFILIFVEVEGYSELESPANAHPPLGIVVMALVLINPIMAIFRPDPTAEKRWIFNILHFLVGLIAHLSAAVALFLATYIQKLRFPEWCRWVMVGYICWHASIEIILAIDMHVTKRRKETKEEIAMNSIQDPAYMYYQPSQKSFVESYSLFRTTLGVLHLVGVLGCAIALSVQIGIS